MFRKSSQCSLFLLFLFFLTLSFQFQSFGLAISVYSKDTTILVGGTEGLLRMISEPTGLASGQPEVSEAEAEPTTTPAPEIHHGKITPSNISLNGSFCPRRVRDCLRRIRCDIFVQRPYLKRERKFHWWAKYCESQCRVKAGVCF